MNDGFELKKRWERLKFSVLISVYAKEKPEFLKKALQSIYNQSLKPNEIVLVKDGVLGDKLNHVIDLEMTQYLNTDTHFICIQLDKNMGLGTALQIGLERCKYDYIVRMDTDDIAVSDRFETQMRYMSAHPHVSVVGGYIGEFITENEILRVKSMPLKHKELYQYGKYRNPLNHMTVCFKKKDIMAVGCYKHLNGLEDYYLWSRVIVNGYTVANIDKVLVYARLSNFEARRGGIKYFFTYLKLRLLQKRIGYINFLEFIISISLTAFITLPPNCFRNILYKQLRKHT